MRLSGRVVAITGASAGIGRATAEHCAKEGAAIAISARRADRLNDVVSAVTGRGGQAIAVPGDVTKDADVRALVARAVEAFGRLDVIVCNAGIGFHGNLEDTTPDVARRLVDVNVLGTIYAAHAAHPVFVRQGFGHIIAISSVAGRRGVAGMRLSSIPSPRRPNSTAACGAISGSPSTRAGRGKRPTRWPLRSSIASRRPGRRSTSIGRPGGLPSFRSSRPGGLTGSCRSSHDGGKGRNDLGGHSHRRGRA